MMSKRKDKQISFRVPAEVHKDLQVAADTVGLKVSTFCRAVVIQNKDESVLWVGKNKK